MNEYVSHRGNILVMAAFSVILFGMGILYSASLRERSTSRETAAYVRVQNCILSYPATSRTQENIDRCYTIVEAESDTKLVRYDKM